MKKRPKVMISTAMMGQLWPEQWLEVVEEVEGILEREGLVNLGVGLEIVAVVKEPLLRVLMARVKKVGLADRVETIHGRVDYDWAAVGGRRKALSGAKFLQLLTYDFFMAWVGEAYRAATGFKYAKLLLHAPTVFQLQVTKETKPRLRKSRVIVENDEKLAYPFGDEQLVEKMSKYGNPFNPVDVLKFVTKHKYSKMVFDTAHVWRCMKGKDELERAWSEFKKLAEKGKASIYWHMNHDNGEHFIIRKKGNKFVSKHDEWLSRVARFAGKRVKKGEDQICFEEPRKVRLKMSDSSMVELVKGLEQSIMSLKEFGGLRSV